MVNYDELIKRLSRTDEPFGLLTMQATSTTSRLMKVFPNRLKALYAAEHGFFGTTAAGELTQGSYHPFFNLPIHSLYGEFRRLAPRDTRPPHEHGQSAQGRGERRARRAVPGMDRRARRIREDEGVPVLRRRGLGR